MDHDLFNHLFYGQVSQNIHGEFVIVTGCPRSGTSLIMQMLDAGGLLAIISPGNRKDVHNPNGYFEISDHHWPSIYKMIRTKKVTSGCLKLIPPYLERWGELFQNVIHVRRDYKEIYNSIIKMGAGYDSGILIRDLKRFDKKIETFLKYTGKQVTNVSYNMLIAGKEDELDKIFQFTPDTLKARLAIDQKLYRNKQAYDPIF